MSAFPPVPTLPTPLGLYRPLSPLAGVRVSPLQLGATSIGDEWNFLGSMNKEQSFKLLDAYHAAGGNFIDTSANYQDEASEKFLGEWMEERGIRTDAEEEERRKTGEIGRTWMGPEWEHTPDEKKMCQALEKVAGEVGAKSIQAVAIAYVMQKTTHVFPILGGRKVEHLNANIEALSIALSKDQLAYIENVLPFDPGFPYWLIVSTSLSCRIWGKADVVVVMTGKRDVARRASQDDNWSTGPVVATAATDRASGKAFLPAPTSGRVNVLWDAQPRAHATMQYEWPPLPLSSASTGTDTVGSLSTEEVVKKVLVKESIADEDVWMSEERTSKTKGGLES
ncbi:hypothetical protein EVG20_g2166 [Dentipellis fragilis]|uniref:NADP-dependent oxidoreductase domain-containing protein n=1 Tax=Dentipellis fragilis TaxID=205917 RepID=A0A4Y9ZBR6_9AGAM|nr:hypothetical protein EVG20_g2166 [Dentipellis fragilis]